MCLIIGIMFAGEAFRHRDDPFYLKHPENFYVLFGFVVFSVLVAIWMYPARVTLVRDKIIEHAPPFVHKEIPLSLLVTIESEAKMTILRFSDRRKISIPHFFEGCSGLIEEIRKRTNLAEP